MGNTISKSIEPEDNFINQTENKKVDHNVVWSFTLGEIWNHHSPTAPPDLTLNARKVQQQSLDRESP